MYAKQAEVEDKCKQKTKTIYTKIENYRLFLSADFLIAMLICWSVKCTLKGHCFGELSDRIFCATKKKKKERKEGRRNQESGAKKCPIPSLNSTSCACLCILFVIAGFSWCACGYVSTEWAYCVGTCRVVFVLFDFFFFGGGVFVKDYSKCCVENPMVCNVLYIHYLMYSKLRRFF